MGANFRQYTIPGGHALRGEADLADGHAAFLLTFTTVEDEFLGPVGSTLTEITVTLNDCIVKDTEFAKQLFAEATRGRQ